MSAKVDPFSQAENCYTKVIPVTSDTEANVNYMVARTLSMNANSFYAAAEMNRLAAGVPQWAVLMLGYTLTPKMTPRRGGYIKKPKSPFTNKEKRIILCIQKQLCCSPDHAADTYDLLKSMKFDFDAYYGHALAE